MATKSNLEKIQSDLENYKTKTDGLVKTVEILTKLFSDTRDLMEDIKKEFCAQSQANQSQFDQLNEGSQSTLKQMTNIEACLEKILPESSNEMQKVLKRLEASMVDNQNAYAKMEEEINDMKQQLQSNKDRINNIEEEIIKATSPIQIEASFSDYEKSSQLSSPMAQSHLAPRLGHISYEKEQFQRYIKRNNIVIYGLEEQVDDLQPARKLVSTISSTFAREIYQTFRIGTNNSTKPRPLVVKFQSKYARDNIYYNVYRLKCNSSFGNIAIAPDFTKVQYLEQKKLYRSTKSMMRGKEEPDIH